MHGLIVAAALLSASAIPDGSLVFLQNSNRVVEKYTGHSVTHVGVVLNHGEESWLYEATPKEVRRIKLANYYAELGEANRGNKRPIRVWLLRPARPYNNFERARMQRFLESQLDRRYSIRSYVRQKPGDGIHCAELAASTLNASGQFELKACHRLSPGQLYQLTSQHYSDPTEVTLPEPDEGRSWCERSWDWWGGFFHWCSWSCYETWTFCR